jgi:hypothetical protein
MVAGGVHKVLPQERNLCIQVEEACSDQPIGLYFRHREFLDREVAGARPGSNQKVMLGTTQKVTNGGFTLGEQPLVLHTEDQGLKSQVVSLLAWWT